MRPKTFIPALLLGVGLAALAAVSAADTADEKAIDKLIKQLGSDTFEDREKAYKALDALGEAALDALSKARDSDDAETKKRARLLVERIEARVRTTKVLGPKEVQFSFKDKPLKEAIAEMAKATGYAIRLHDPEGKLKDKTVTLDTGKTTFWDALAQLGEKAGLNDGDPNRAGAPRAPANPGGLPQPALIQPAAPPPPPVQPKKDAKKEENNGAGAGDAPLADLPAPNAPKPQAQAPAVLQVPGPNVLANPGLGGGLLQPWLNVQAGEIVLVAGKAPKGLDAKAAVRVRPAERTSLLAPDDREHLALTLELTVEPRLRWLNVGQAKIEKATDDQDQKLEMVDPAAGGPQALGGPGGGPAVLPAFAGFGSGSANGLSRYVALKFKKGDKATKSFKELQGSVPCTMLGDAEDLVTVDAVVKADGKTVKGKKGGEITINKVTKTDGEVRIEFTLEKPDKVRPEQVNMPMQIEAAAPRGGALPAAPPPAADKPAALPAKPAKPDNQANAAQEKKADKPAAAPAGPAPAVIQLQLPAAPAGGGPAMPMVAFNGTGVTLRGEKNELLFARVSPDFTKMQKFNVNQKKWEYVAVYRPGKGMPAEPTKLVFTARAIVDVTVPFVLKDAEVK